RHRAAVERHGAGRAEHDGDPTALAHALLGRRTVLGEGGVGEGRRAAGAACRPFGVGEPAAEGGAAGRVHRDGRVAGEVVGVAGQGGTLTERGNGAGPEGDVGGTVQEPAPGGDVDHRSGRLGAVAGDGGTGHRDRGGVDGEEGAAAPAGQAGLPAREPGGGVVAHRVVVEGDITANGKDAAAEPDGLEVAVRLGRVVAHGRVGHGGDVTIGENTAGPARSGAGQDRHAGRHHAVVVDGALVECHGALVVDPAAHGRDVDGVGGPGDVARDPQPGADEHAEVLDARSRVDRGTDLVDAAALDRQVVHREEAVVLQDREVGRALGLGAGDGGAVAVDGEPGRGHVD